MSGWWRSEGICGRALSGADGGARLAVAARTQSTFAALPSHYAAFLTTHLLFESAHVIRGNLQDGFQRSVVLAPKAKIDCLAFELTILTDLAVCKAKEYGDILDWESVLNEKQVVVCTSSVLRQIMAEKLLTMNRINLMIIESCHCVYSDADLEHLMKVCSETDTEERPRILALTYPLFSHENKKARDVIEAKNLTQNDKCETEKIECETKMDSETAENNCDILGNNNEFLDIINDDSLNMNKLTIKEIHSSDEHIDNINVNNNDEINVSDSDNNVPDKVDETNCENEISKEINELIPRKDEIKSESSLEVIEDKTDHLSEELCDKSDESSSDSEFDLTVTANSDIDMYSKFEWKLEEFEAKLLCVVDLAEDIEGFKRVSWGQCRPKECLVQYLRSVSNLKLPVDYLDLEYFMRTTVAETLAFLQDHRYDPSEIYGDDLFSEELKGIPDPTLDPKKVFQQFLYALDELGPYGADKAAFNLLVKLEKLKIKIPYERHFLLLCLCTTVLVKIRCATDNLFRAYESDLEKIRTFSKPKVLRLLEILKQFKPSEDDAARGLTAVRCDSQDGVKTSEHDGEQLFPAESAAAAEIQNGDGGVKSKLSEMVDEIDSCDFKSLGDKLEDKVNEMAMDLKELPEVAVPKVKAEKESAGGRKRMTGRDRRIITRAGHQRKERNVSDSLCGLVLVREPIMAEVLFMILAEATRADPDLSFICAQYSAGDFPDPSKELKDYEHLRKKQEEVLKKFRMHDCNLLLAANGLEEGIELPRCNLIVRWDQPQSYYWSCWSRARARAPRSAVCSLIAGRRAITTQAVYMHLDQILNQKCGCGAKDEPPTHEEEQADFYSQLIEPYCPLRTVTDNGDAALRRSDSDDDNDAITAKDAIDDSELASVDLNNAISLINRYCGKLPSDTFTRLTPTCAYDKVRITHARSGAPEEAFICTIRLPVNCPVKYNIVGHPMRTKSLARRIAALQACRVLHKSGELDHHLMPIGKENYKCCDKSDDRKCCAPTTMHRNETDGDGGGGDEPARPGTTKRRQYYYKRTAWSFTDCEPIVDNDDRDKTDAASNPDSDDNAYKKENRLYALDCNLWCPLPERYNTRGRRIHAPQNSKQALALLTSREIRKIPAFPVYTRSGEVRVTVTPVHGADVTLTQRRAHIIRRFMHFVFADVLRIRRRGMRMCSDIKQNNYYIVPTKKSAQPDGGCTIGIDWPFLELIYDYTESRCNQVEGPIIDLKDIKEEENDDVTGNEETEKDKEESSAEGRKQTKKMDNPFLKPGEVFKFEAEQYREAVVTPWYRNQDQPQYFLVAEICWQLTADSPFPSPTHSSFRHYYSDKYGVEITQPKQPLLDVDHTSGRLNLLTPRYVNRKGVALPVSSERTRRARRERLDQKQLLVPELSATHPFGAPLWAAAVALPAMLYRINTLLIADEIRRSVAIEVGLGIPDVNERTMPGFEWAPLDFGWSLADVLRDGDRRDKAKEKESEEIDNTAERESEDVEEALETKKEQTEDKEDEKDDAVAMDDDGNGFEIGMWSNEMASSIPDHPELTFCDPEEGGIDWSEKFRRGGHPTGAFSVADSDCSYMSSDFDTDDSDLNSDTDSDDTSGFCSSKAANAAVGVRIEYRTAREAEAVEVRPLKAPAAPTVDPRWEVEDRASAALVLKSGTLPDEHLEKFRSSVERNRKAIVDKNLFIDKNRDVANILPTPTNDARHRTPNQEISLKSPSISTGEALSSNTMQTELPIKCDAVLPLSKYENSKLHEELFPYGNLSDLDITPDGRVTIKSIETSKRNILRKLKMADTNASGMTCFSMCDVDIDSVDYVDAKKGNTGFDCVEDYAEKVRLGRVMTSYEEVDRKKPFDFDYQPSLDGHPGPNPSVILQALTMSNANDGINLERLETVGDSFLKFAITAFLYCAKPGLHEGKLSHMRSKQVSNLNLYRLGKAKQLGGKMIGSKFEPHDNWLPPGHAVPRTLAARNSSDSLDWESSQRDYLVDAIVACPQHCSYGGYEYNNEKTKCECTCADNREGTYLDNSSCFIPYNLITQHSIPDKSVADCVEALIGAYLVECGPRGALLFMSWLGIKVLPIHAVPVQDPKPFAGRSSVTYERFVEDCDLTSLAPPGHLEVKLESDGKWYQPVYGALQAPPSPLLLYVKDPDGELQRMLSGYDKLEATLRYRFRDRSLLLQALTHASHHTNTLTDCYQRLELLGDAVLDYIITRLLYEDERRHSPGALTDLRSALVNNTIFATLAVRHGFHKYFRHMSPGLHEVLAKYVRIQEENGHSISEEHYLIHEDEMEQAEDVEVPKALGDLFESIAGAIYLDSGMSLGAVWRSYAGLMASELELFSAAAPKSPVRELLEAEPDTAKFHKPERLADGRRVRVSVEVFGRGTFKGIGRNYRIAKGTAARCALRHLRGVHHR